jgi:predicted dehydrogenase
MAPMNMEEVRWGIIGCGDVCEVKSGPALYKTPRSRLVAVMRRDGAKAADFARRHGVPRSYDTVDALITDPAVNAVYIATPPGTHRDLARRVADAGKPCLVEKPMARTHGECQTMLDAFARRNLPLFVAYYRRGMARFIKTRSLLESGAIGTISGVSYRMSRSDHRRGGDGAWRLNLPHSGGGLFLDVGSHTLDILDFLLGPLSDVTGVARNCAGVAPDVEDSVAMSFTIAGAPGTAAWYFASDRDEDRIDLFGTDGTISLSTFGHEPVILTRGTSVDPHPFPAPAHVHSGLIESIVADLTTGQHHCPSTGESASRTSKVMDEVLRSFYGDREKLFATVPSDAA